MLAKGTVVNLLSETSEGVAYVESSENLASLPHKRYRCLEIKEVFSVLIFRLLDHERRSRLYLNKSVIRKGLVMSCRVRLFFWHLSIEIGLVLRKASLVDVEVL